jgi:hypothetical protein
MKTFKEKGYEIVRNAISKEVAELLSLEFKLLKDNLCLASNLETSSKLFNNDIDKSFGWYSAYCFESLSLFLLPKIEEVVEKKIFPTYTYGRIYYTGATLGRHTDRHSSDYAVSICIKKDPVSWLIGFKDLLDKESLFDLEVGDMCVYLGKEVEHWRDAFQGSEQIQAFLFYVDQQGKNSHLKYDTRPYLGMPYDSKKIKD